ncbi:MAG: mechanosensitive ion channel [Alistipes sp.]|nr:mechanosensitive ion channel [Alistipes sp.]
MKNLLFISAQTEEGAAVAENGAEAAAEVVKESPIAINSVDDVKESVEQLFSIDYSQLVDKLLEGALVVGLKIIAALVIYYLGRWVVRRVMKLMDKVYEKKSVEKSLRSFLSGVVKVLLYVVIVLIIIQVLGINTTSLVAMIASAGLAIGMALSGTLQNFAGGVMILLLRPYRIGDYIDAQGEEGTVTKIGLFSTEIITVDNRIIYIPNSTISTSVIDNYSTSEMRRVDWTVSVEYGSDPEKVRQVLVDMLKSDSRVAADPAPVVFLVNLADSSVQFSARAWCKNGDFWGLKFDIQERIYVELPKNGINFPFPQLDVNLKK